VFLTLAVAFIRMVTGSGPQENRITPPRRTAEITAADVQLAAVPLPITRVAWELFTGPAAAGTGTERAPDAECRCIDHAVGAIHPQVSIKLKSSHALTPGRRRLMRRA
jgi:hypothetical protein